MQKTNEIVALKVEKAFSDAWIDPHFYVWEKRKNSADAWQIWFAFFSRANWRSLNSNWYCAVMILYFWAYEQSGN